MSLADLAPGERHRSAAAGLTQVVRQVADWDAPTPVPQWRARDVVDHLVTWFPGFLAGGGVSLPPVPPVEPDPVRAWEAHTAAVQELLDDPARAGRTFEHPHVPPQSLAATIDAFYTADVVMHTWDLARSAGIDVELDATYCTQLLEGMVGMEEVMRGSGQYGPAVPVPAHADPQTRLMGFIGRDPAWRPPTA
ncbi:TIGR03086 family metal-binding protein [Pseudactinotalea suaedae]|uniref:TIGR03086 family metal-binding protein n=1 Tax=Pseudactinotalea suaedae TaxID=1524924 RepID=UPI0012E23EE7|nr:TIGR03086 family metal-binding protein [Pseudactinotalea suaedae]